MTVADFVRDMNFTEYGCFADVELRELCGSKSRKIPLPAEDFITKRRFVKAWIEPYDDMNYKMTIWCRR